MGRCPQGSRRRRRLPRRGRRRRHRYGTGRHAEPRTLASRSRPCSAARSPSGRREGTRPRVPRRREGQRGGKHHPRCAGLERRRARRLVAARLRGGRARAGDVGRRSRAAARGRARRRLARLRALPERRRHLGAAGAGPVRPASGGRRRRHGRERLDPDRRPADRQRPRGAVAARPRARAPARSRRRRAGRRARLGRPRASLRAGAHGRRVPVGARVLRRAPEGRRARARGESHPCRAPDRRRPRIGAPRDADGDLARRPPAGRRAVRGDRAHHGPRAVKLYDAAGCPYCARVRIVLAEKEIDHETVEIDLRDRPSWMYDLNPSGKVPVLDDGFVLPESAVIMEYLEERHPDTALLPADRAERARARLAGFRSDELLGDDYYAFRRGEPNALEERLVALPTGLSLFSDIAYVPWVIRTRDRLGVRLPPNLAGWLEALAERPSIARELDVVAAL